MIVIAFCCIVINLCQTVTIFSRQGYIASAVVTSLLMLIPLVLCIRKETVFWNEAKQEPKHETRPQVDAPKENQDSNPGFWEKKKIRKDIFGYNGSVCSSYGNYYGWDGPGGAA